MKTSQRVVLDTNTLISGVLLVESIPGQAVRQAITDDQVLMSDASLDELVTVLSRKKFDRYLRVEDRAEFVHVRLRVVDIVPIITTVRACRDDADNRILEVAVNGDAEVIVSGDRDLLVLHPFRGISILTPRAYLKRGR